MQNATNFFFAFKFALFLEFSQEHPHLLTIFDMLTNQSKSFSLCFCELIYLWRWQLKCHQTANICHAFACIVLFVFIFFLHICWLYLAMSYFACFYIFFATIHSKNFFFASVCQKLLQSLANTKCFNLNIFRLKRWMAATLLW